MGDYRKLKAMLHDELDRIADKDELNPSSLDMVDKLAHALKCIATVEAMEDVGYSEHDGMSYGADTPNVTAWEDTRPRVDIPIMTGDTDDRQGRFRAIHSGMGERPGNLPIHRETRRPVYCV